MTTAASVLAELTRLGNEKTRTTYARHGMAVDRTLGVSVAEMKAVAKSIRGQHALACGLYETGRMEAMYTAGLVLDGAKVTAQQLEAWVELAAGLPMVYDFTIPWLAVENAAGAELAGRWIESPKEHTAAAGWRTFIGLVSTVPDSALDVAELERLLDVVVTKIDAAPDPVRKAMNSFVIAAGKYVRPLLAHAKAAATRMGAVVVDPGDTACKVPSAPATIAKAESAGTIGSKRKTIRC